MAQAFQLSIDNQGIARLVFDLPNEKLNTLSLPVLEELEKIIDELAQRKDIKALLFLSGKEDSFIVGADLKRFAAIFKDMTLAKQVIDTGHRVFSKLETLPFPTIAYIHGPCMGGGTEMALAFKYRVVSDNSKTAMSLPEVTLGIIPGWGGTQRLPRLVGLIEALGIILTGKPVKAQKAWKIHLADALVANEFKEEKLSEFIATILTDKGRQKVLERRKPGGMQHWLLEANPLGRIFVYSQAKKDILKRTKGHYPSPLMALQVIKDSYGLPLEQGLQVEKIALLKNFQKGTDIPDNLIQLFFTQEALKKDTGAPEGIKPQPIKSAAVLGAGVMGGGIAWLLSYRDYPVRMRDIDYTALGKGYGAIKSLYDQYVKDKRLKRDEASLKFQHLSGTTDLTGFEHVDLVIEAAVENLELKNKLFADVEAKIPETAMIASNTSSLSISTMAKALKHPERFVGMHFFNPVHRMPLVEIVAGEKTSPQTIATAVEFCKKLGKTPMVVGDCAGFLVNRIFAMGANEVVRMLQEGISYDKLDKMMLHYGFPMGPFVLADEVGNDVMYKVNKVLEEAYGERMAGPKVLHDMYEKQLFGKKVGKGFYLWQGKKHTFNPVVKELLGTPASSNSIPEMEMQDRVTLSMINEAARCLEEKVIGRPDYLDMALIMGTGFPPFRGGLLRYADALGIDYVVDHLNSFEKKYGMRFKPCNLLLDMQKTHKTFY